MGPRRPGDDGRRRTARGGVCRCREARNDRPSGRRDDVDRQGDERRQRWRPGRHLVRPQRRTVRNREGAHRRRYHLVLGARVAVDRRIRAPHRRMEGAGDDGADRQARAARAGTQPAAVQPGDLRRAHLQVQRRDTGNTPHLPLRSGPTVPRPHHPHRHRTISRPGHHRQMGATQGDDRDYVEPHP